MSVLIYPKCCAFHAQTESLGKYGFKPDLGRKETKLMVFA